MKRILVSLMAVALFATFATAQNEDYKSTITLNAGFSLVGSLISAFDYGGTTDVSSYSIPAIQFNYDYGVAKWFSIGAAVSYQMMGLDYTDYGTNSEDFKTDIKRLNFGMRSLFHYANSGRVDLYSGFRIGFTNWTIDTETDDPTYDPTQDVSFSEGLGFAPQLILFGIRGYLTESIGINSELCVGSPHYYSIGLNYRF